MIDKKQPPPGFHWVGVDGTRVSREATLAMRAGSYRLADAWSTYAEESRLAVIDFAECVAAYLHTIGVVQDDVILAAARGERSLP